MNPKELFYRKIDAHKPQVMENASEAGLHNIASPTAHELISNWVMEDAAETGLEPMANLGVLRARLADLRTRQEAHRRRISLAIDRFGGTIARSASTRFGRILEGSLDLGAIATRPVALALMAARVALVQASLGRVETHDAERTRIRDAASATLLALFEHYRARGAAATALGAKKPKVGGLN